MILAVVSSSIILSVSLSSPDRSIPLQVKTEYQGVDAVVHAFDRHSIVLLGEVHWSNAEHRFIQKLLRDTRIPCLVDDIAIEAGNSLYQPLIDRFVAGDAVPADSIQLAWRNTTQPMAWDPPVYGAIYRAVREVNRGLPPSKRMRVVALDPPIDWSSVRSAADFPRIWGYRDPVWFTTLEKEVLSKHRKVLVIAGGLHILRRDPPGFTPQSFDRVGLGDALAQRYESQTFRIYPAIGSTGVGKRFAGKPAGTVLHISGTAFGALSSQMLWPSGVTMFRKVNGQNKPYTLQTSEYPAIGSLIDEIMYFGSDTTSSRPQRAIYRECAYVSELRRRNALLLPIFGFDRDPELASLAGKSCPS
jgi:hypothetical protein